MLNNFIYAQTKGLFLEALEAGNILDEAIVFIEDTKEIWNHGHYFAGESVDPNAFADLQDRVATISEEKLDVETAATTYAPIQNGVCFYKIKSGELEDWTTIIEEVADPDIHLVTTATISWHLDDAMKLFLENVSSLAIDDSTSFSFSIFSDTVSLDEMYIETWQIQDDVLLIDIFMSATIEHTLESSSSSMALINSSKIVGALRLNVFDQEGNGRTFWYKN